MNISNSMPSDRTPGAALPVAGAGRGADVGIAVREFVRAAIDVLDFEIDAVERVQLEVLEVLAEQGDVDVDAAAVILEAELERVVDFRIELQIAGAGRRGDAARDGRSVEALTTPDA